MNNGKSIGAILVCIFIAILIAIAGGQNSPTVFGSLNLYMLCAAVGFVLHWLVFVPSYIYRTEHYFDLTGSVSFIVAICLAYFLNSTADLRSFLLAAMIFIWAARLGTFLFRRVKKDGSDQRFNELKTNFWRFAVTWTLGGLWVFLTMAAPLAAITSSQQVAFDGFAIIGLLLWIMGFTMEVVADYQKSQFRKEPGNRQKFISSGLWGRSRHPNYFGEILLWIGLTVIAFPVLSGWQLLTLISPVFVIVLLTRVSGIPLLEEKAEKNWGSSAEYQTYKRNTPVLIPRLTSV